MICSLLFPGFRYYRQCRDVHPGTKVYAHTWEGFLRVNSQKRDCQAGYMLPTCPPESCQQLHSQRRCKRLTATNAAEQHYFVSDDCKWHQDVSMATSLLSSENEHLFFIGLSPCVFHAWNSYLSFIQPSSALFILLTTEQLSPCATATEPACCNY